MPDGIQNARKDNYIDKYMKCSVVILKITI